MNNYLLKVEETYRADTENEAARIIENAKHDPNFVLVKYASVKRHKKAKGEVVDEWYRVTLTKAFTDEKEPDRKVEITYN